MGEGLAGKGGQRKHYQTYHFLVPEANIGQVTYSKNKTLMVRIMVCYSFHFEKNKCWHQLRSILHFVNTSLKVLTPLEMVKYSCSIVQHRHRTKLYLTVLFYKEESAFYYTDITLICTHPKLNATSVISAFRTTILVTGTHFCSVCEIRQNKR